MKVKRLKSFRFKIVMYIIYSFIATLVTELLIIGGLYLYEADAMAEKYSEVWGTSGQTRLDFSTFIGTKLPSTDLLVYLIFTVLLLILYFVLFSHQFVVYVREIISHVEQMKNGDEFEEIPVMGEDEFSVIADSINQMCKNLQENMEAQKMVEATKDELITNVAHDLRTPLTSILGYMDLLTQENYLTEEQKSKYLEIVSSKAKQLERLIKDLFDYTRYEKGKVKLKKEIVDLNLFVPQLVDEFYPSFVDHQLKCLTEFYEGSLDVEVNGELLARAIGNLLSNAIKYGSDGKIVEVKTGQEGQMAYVTVINYGKIIAQEDLEKIFDKFYRVENSRSLKTGGTGLGLAIAKNIVSMHDGNIWADSGENGTRFQIELPLAAKAE